jgi:hypothetical protein
MAASRWSPASGDSHDASAAATMDDLDTPFLAASSSRRLACSGWMNRLRRYWLIGRFRRWGRGKPAGPCAAWPGRAGREAAAAVVVVIEQRQVVAGGCGSGLYSATSDSSGWRRGPPSSAGRAIASAACSRPVRPLVRAGIASRSSRRAGPVAHRRTARPQARAAAARALEIGVRRSSAASSP